MGQPFTGTLVGGSVHFKRQPRVNVGHKLFVILGIHGQLVVNWQDDSETVFFIGVTLGGVHQVLVVLEQQFGGVHGSPAIYVNHHQIETSNAVLFIAVTPIQVMCSPMHARCLSQLVQLVPSRGFIGIACGHVLAVRHHHLVQISFFEGFPAHKLNAIAERLFDDDVVFVAIGNGQRQHFTFVAGTAFVKRQVFRQISLGDFLLHSSKVLG